MMSFRRFSRRAWPLHVWLMLSLLLWPVPTVRSYWTDSNQDGVKEWVDEAGLDPSWWDADSDDDGLTNAQEALYGSDPYAKDSDRDGLSDLVERDYTPPSAPFDPWSWDTDGDGYSDHDEYYLLIQGSPLVVHYPSLGGIYYDYRDADGDGLLNYEDSDPVNMDRDGDGLRNWEDSWMDDAMNGYVPPAYDPGVYIGGTWYPSGTLDSDFDGIPDHLDPFAWGSFWYNGIEYGGSWADRDADGIPDSADTYPDGSYWYNGVEYGGMWSDMDGDGVPDPADPSPVYVESYWYGGTEYLGIWQDSDSDGIPDPADAYMWDPWNGQPYYDYNGSQYPGESVDRDGDGVPDAADSWPDDPENGADDDNDGLSNYDERTQHFTDPHDVDSDNDWLTDYEELYVFQTNPKAPRSALASGQTLLDGQLHLGADADGDELPDVLEDYYASLGYGLDKNDPADGAGDLDSDGYTNAHAFTLGWSLIANRGTYDQDHDGIDDAVEAYWAAVYPGSMDKAVFEDAVADHDQDGLMNYEEVVRHNVNGWLLPADPGDPYSLMRSQGYEVVPGVTPNDGQFMRWWWDVDRADYGGTVDGTPVPAPDSLRDVTDMDPAPNGLPDGYERWVATYGEGFNTARAILADEDGDGMPNVWEHRHRLAPRDATDAVSPLGGVTLPPEPVMPDANDPLYYTDDGAGPQFVQAWYDTAMAEYGADVVERRLALALRPSYDPDGDLLANLDEYLHGTHPRIADSDLDGFEDGAEVADGSAPTAFASIPPVRLRVVSGGGQSIATGLGAQRPLVVMVSQGGIPRSGAPITFACSDQRLLLNNGVNTITLLADEEGRATIAIAGAPAGTAGPATVQVTAPEVAAALSVSFTLNTTIPGGGGGGGGGGGPVPTPFSTPPPQYHLFTALRERRVSYSGHEIPSHPTDSQPIGSTTEWYKQQETTPRPAFSDDGFNGDADLQGDNEDPGDPRDDMASTGKYSEVPTTEGDPDAYSMENIAWATTNIGPFSGFKTTYGVYTANNAYPNPGAEDVKQAHVSAFFDHATAVSHLGDVAYQRGDASNGWQGNGPDGITSYQVMSTHTVNTSTLTISYLDDESGEALEDSAQVRSCSGRVEQAQVRLQTNTPVDTAHPARTLYNLLKRTIASGGETYTAQATIELSISSGQVSDTATVLSGTLPADVQAQNGVITMTSPATTQGVMTAWVLLPIDIEPDANMAGLVGDVVKSAKAGSTVEHFVTPKKSTELNQDYVVLKAVGVTADQITDGNPNQIVEWDKTVGEAFPGDPLKWRVKRDATNKHEVKIKTKQGGAVAAQMDVWVVWVDFTSKLTGTSAIDGSTLGLHSGRTSAGYQGATGIDYTGTIEPKAIITEQERPALEKQQRQAPPGSDLGVAGPGNSDASGSEFSGWDTSRQKTRRLLIGPNLTPTGANVAGSLNAPVDYPADPLDGNDDASVGGDEDSDPYTAGKGSIGQLLVNDEPRKLLLDALDSIKVNAGQDGDRLHYRIWFREFARVQIGTKWYLVSKKEPWRFYMFAKRISGQWQAEPGTQEVFDTTNTDLP